MTKIIDLFAERAIPYIEGNNATHERDNFAKKRKENIALSENESKTYTNNKDSFIQTSGIESDKEVNKYQELKNSTTQEKPNIEKNYGSENKNPIENIGSDLNIGKSELTESEQKMVEELKQIDREVRNHESAHRSAGGGLVRGGASYTYRMGPDGRQYAVAGEVKIDFSYDLDNPEETIRTMQQIKRAALAPSDPSTQDRMVATKAANVESTARTELMKSRQDNNNPKNIGINFLEKKYNSDKLKDDSNLKSTDNYSKLF